MAPKLNFSLSLQYNRATLLPQQLQLQFPFIVNIFPAADADQIFSKHFQIFTISFSAADAYQIFSNFFQPLMQINEIDVSPGFESQVI